MGEALWQARDALQITTGGMSAHEVTREVAGWLSEQGATEGIVTIFCRHTSASLIIMENADPDVLADLVDALGRLAPENVRYRHGLEGPDDMPAHIKTALTQTHLSVPVSSGRLDMGTWQGIWLLEHRARAHRRELTLHYVGT